MTNELVPFDGGVQIIQRHSMFELHGRTTQVVECHNQSIEDLFREHVPLDLPCVCSLNGEMITRDEWPLTMVAEHDCVLFTPTLQGGGGNKGMQILGALLMIVAVVLYIYAGPVGGLVQGLAGGMLAGVEAVTIGSAVAFGVGVLGAGLLMTGMVPDTLAAASAKASLSSWSPQTTQVQGGCVPKYYGLHRLVGNIIATYITDATVNAKEVQYLYTLIDLGMGPYENISTFKINNVDTNTLQQVSIVARNGHLIQDMIPGFEKTPVSITESQLLLYNVPVVRQTTGASFDKLTVKTLFSNGLGMVDEVGNMGLANVELEVKIKRSTDSEWIYLTSQPTTLREVVTAGQWILSKQNPDDAGSGGNMSG